MIFYRKMRPELNENKLFNLTLMGFDGTPKGDLFDSYLYIKNCSFENLNALSNVSALAEVN